VEQVSWDNDTDCRWHDRYGVHTVAIIHFTSISFLAYLNEYGVDEKLSQNKRARLPVEHAKGN
jgi:hypothetical protein